ncbi:zinc finger MYM-type protein 1-like [Salmo trutta]|uniref:zinc finger MYM-type protein 1-like n=1 Tax=Salmo trutta TaxID=8032 RepID=UPI00112FEEDC|nr:zinc finger MYM-type protein 1-like [Salmo trutta]
MHACGNAKYISHQIQNKVLEGLAEMVQREIIREVKESEVFSVIADETKDLKKKEQMSLVVSYYYNGAIHKGFLHFQSAESLDAAGLTKIIIDCLEKHGLGYRNNLVGQGYDGALVMSGKHSGVSARIKNSARFAFYVHCNAHSLNLVLVDANMGMRKEVFRELFRLCTISVVTPVSSASCERSFSALKLIKTPLRTTMVDDRLSHLGILSVESRTARSLNMDEFVKHFASSHQNCRVILF